VKIYSTYRPVSKPLGGANNFIITLFKYIEKNSGKILYEFNDQVDLIFINQLSKGHGRGFLSFINIFNIKILSLIYKKPIYTRLVNLNTHAFNKGPRYLLFGYLQDFKTYILIYISNYVIFQSEYQKSFFLKNAPFFVKNKTIHFRVIHNGADNIFSSNLTRRLRTNEKIILVSNTFSTRNTKLHSLIAQFSLLPNIEVLHIGNWPSFITNHKVKLLGVLPKSEIIKIYSKAHYFLHTAIKDPCPNVIFEALLNGLPIIFNSDVGSSFELVKENGIAIDSSNLFNTIREAYYKYDSLVNIVNFNKPYYSIDRSISEYSNFLKNKI